MMKYRSEHDQIVEDCDQMGEGWNGIILRNISCLNHGNNGYDLIIDYVLNSIYICIRFNHPFGFDQGRSPDYSGLAFLKYYKFQ